MTEHALTEQAPWREKEPWIRELVTVLTYYEILARRRKKITSSRAIPFFFILFLFIMSPFSHI